MIQKSDIIKTCQNILFNKKGLIIHAQNEIFESMQSETKSSVGDKHETSRAKLHSELEKLGVQLDEVNKQEIILQRININQVKHEVNLGTLVKADKATFFIAIGLGKIQVNAEEIIVISALSPLASKMNGCQIGDYFTFNQIDYQVQKID